MVQRVVTATVCRRCHYDDRVGSRHQDCLDCCRDGRLDVSPDICRNSRHSNCLDGCHGDSLKTGVLKAVLTTTLIQSVLIEQPQGRLNS